MGHSASRATAIATPALHLAISRRTLSDHLFQYLTGAPDYEVPIFQFNVPLSLASHFISGIAMTNYVLASAIPTTLEDLRQSIVVTSTFPEVNALFGHSTLLQHEVGHHIGFSHPFHGYRCLTDSCGDGEFLSSAGRRRGTRRLARTRPAS